MNKIVMSLFFCFVFHIGNASQADNYKTQVTQSGLLESVSNIHCLSDILTTQEIVHEKVATDINFITSNLQRNNEIYQLEEAKNRYDYAQVVQEFIQNPGQYYYIRNNFMPESVKQSAFEVIRAQGALRKDVNSPYWRDSFHASSAKLHDAIGRSMPCEYLYPKELDQDMVRLRSLKKERDAELDQLHKVWARSSYLMQVSNVLVHKHRLYLSATIIQSHVKKFLRKCYIENITQSISADILKNCLDECMHNIAYEQMNLAEQENRMKMYENMLDHNSKEIVDNIIKSAVDELQQEAKLEQVKREELIAFEKIEREKQKAKLKKNRQKENKKKAKLTEKEEADLITEQIKLNKFIEQEAQRNQYCQTLVQSGSISESNLKLAILGYDIRHLELFNDQGDITGHEHVKTFFKLFEDFLRTPFLEDVSLWDDVLIIIDTLHKKNGYLYQYVQDVEQLRKSICAKEKEVNIVRQNILKTSSKASYDKARQLYVQTNNEIDDLVNRCNKLPVHVSSRHELLLKISAHQENLKKIKNALVHYEEKCHQILLIQKIRHLQDTHGPFPLFIEPLPAVGSLGCLTEQDLQDCRDYLQKELAFWLKYEDEVTLNDLQQSLCKIFKKLPLDEQEVDVFGSSMSSDAFNCAHHNIAPSLQHCFELMCKKHAMEKTSYNQEFLADIAKIQDILLEYYLKYKEQRVS